MYKYVDSFTNRSGDSLPGYHARLFDSDGDAVPIFADANGTPIANVSGIANTAVSDDNGMFRWYVDYGTYDIRFSDPNDVFVTTEPGVPMGVDLSDQVGEAEAAAGAAADSAAEAAASADALNVATDTQALIASNKPLTVGTNVRTSDGFVYEVAAPGVSDQHLTTAGGAKLYVIPQGPSAKQWGILPDTGVDLATRLLTALANHPGELLLEEGVYLTSKGLRQTLDGSIFRGAGVGKTIVRAYSPLNDGAADGTDGNEAIVWAMGAEGAPVYGLKCEDMTLDCAGLMTGLPSGDVYMKGHHYRRVHKFEVNRVEVLDCGSYAFWANDKIIEDGGTITGCIGVYNDCVAKDAEIFFESTGRNYLTYNRPRAEQTRGSWAWPVYETYHFYGGDGLITVNDGYAKVKSSTVIGPLLTQKNVIWNGGYYEQLDTGTGVIAMGGVTSNFDNWAFNDVTMIGAGPVGTLSFGGASDANNKMTINGGKWIANAGVGPVFTAISVGWGSVDIMGLDCVSTTTGAAVPRSLTQTTAFKSFNVFGGNQEAFGPAVSTSPVNAPNVKFSNTKMVPSAAAVVPNIRQLKQGSVTVAGSGFGQINFFMPLNIVDVTKVIVVATVRTVSGTNATGAGEGVAVTWNNPSANVINILLPSAAIGKIVTYSVTEYE